MRAGRLTLPSQAMLSVRRARQLLQPRLRREAGLFLAEGPHLLAAALAAGTSLRTVYATERASSQGETGALIAEAASRGVPVDVLPDVDLAGLTATETPQGVVAVAAIPEPPRAPFGDPDANPRGGSAAGGLWLYLDAVQDPGNVGTLLRSAEAFGLRGALLGKGTADPWSSKVVRSAQGAHFRLPVLAERYAHFEPASLLAALSEQGGEVWTTALDGEDVYQVPPPPASCVLVVGNEAHGVRAYLDAQAARRVRVPQRGSADSLNVAMATTVVLSWLTQTRS